MSEYSKEELEQLKFRVEHADGVMLDSSEMFVQVPNSFMRNRSLNVTEKVLYIYIWGYGVSTGQAYPSQTRIMDDLGISKPTIRKTLASLQEKKAILILNRIFKGTNEKSTNLYCLCRIDYKTGEFDNEYLEKLKVIYPDKKVYI